jgi:hypothetical protein
MLVFGVSFNFILVHDSCFGNENKRVVLEDKLKRFKVKLSIDWELLKLIDYPDVADLLISFVDSHSLADCKANEDAASTGLEDLNGDLSFCTAEWMLEDNVALRIHQ